MAKINQFVNAINEISKMNSVNMIFLYKLEWNIINTTKVRKWVSKVSYISKFIKGWVFLKAGSSWLSEMWTS